MGGTVYGIEHMVSDLNCICMTWNVCDVLVRLILAFRNVLSIHREKIQNHPSVDSMTEDGVVLSSGDRRRKETNTVGEARRDEDWASPCF